jgi:hypothetical protein
MSHNKKPLEIRRRAPQGQVSLYRVSVRAALLSASAALVVLLAFLICAPATAAARQENDVLKKHKLKAAGSLQVLENEAEFKLKLTDLKRLQRQLSYSIAQQQGTLSADQVKKTVENLKNEVNQMNAEIRSVGQQMSSLPRRRGRLVNNIVEEQYAELLLYQNQLKSQVSQESAWLKQLQNVQKADPTAKEKIDAEVGDRRLTYHQALQDLRALADEMTAKYAELAKAPEVKSAIQALGQGKRDKPRLGPSHDFLNNVKALEKFEQAESASESDPFQEKPARRSRGKSRSRSKAAGSDPKSAEKPGQF